MADKNVLFYGDNLQVLRQHVRDESVDLVYLDPPFNSNQNYNVLFQERDGTRSPAQIAAFEDTWTWDQAAAADYQEAVEAGGKAADALRAFRTFLGDTDMLAYLSMMAPRLIELRRVMKDTASIYLHCDPTSSHYLKVLMDAVFSPGRFLNEVIWQRTNARSTGGRWPRVHDVLLFYSRGEEFGFKAAKTMADPRKLPHTLITWSDGQKYQTYELTAAGITKEGESGRSWRGKDPSEMGRHWANSLEQREEWDRRGLIHWPKGGGFPRRRDTEPFKHEKRSVTVPDVWTDISRINQAAKERLGYPTQKPKALLERIIKASSDEGDLVLDPFCGCGTALEVAEQLKRRWVGIDVTCLATSLTKHRLRGAFGDSVEFDVVGEPTTLSERKKG